MSGRQDPEAGKLFAELSEYEKKGIDMMLDGFPASPMQIVQAHVMREDVIYMRDYVMDEKGDVEKLGFYNVKL